LSDLAAELGFDDQETVDIVDTVFLPLATQLSTRGSE
jgi:hypothetical protein